MKKRKKLKPFDAWVGVVNGKVIWFGLTTVPGKQTEIFKTKAAAKYFYMKAVKVRVSEAG